MDAVGCKAIGHYHKIKHVFMFFPMKHHNHEVFKYFNSFAFALPLLRFTYWNTTESARRRKKKIETSIIYPTRFQASFTKTYGTG